MGVAEREDELETEQHDTDTEETELQDSEGEAEEGVEAEEGAEGADDGGSEGEDEDIVQIGSEEPPASEEVKAAPKWVKDLRERQRQLARENAELKAKLGTPSVQQPPQLPEKPKLADFDFDEEKFQAAVDGWYAKKREVEAFQASQKAAAEAHQKAVQAVHENYAKSKQALKVKDFQDAEDAVQDQFSQVQQSIVMAGAANPGAVVYALGRNPKKLQELASIKDPVKFAVAVGKLETEVKVTRRTSTKPAPETPLRGNSNASASKATLERLQAEADRTGDRTKVAAYIRQQRLAGK